MKRLVQLLCLVASLSLTLAAPARAEDDTTQRARDLYAKGADAQQARDWPNAYAAFVEAFKLKRHYQIAANLGVVEIELGRHRDAAEHLAFALADIKRDTQVGASDIQAIAELLRKAQAKVVTLELKVTLVGAERATYSLLVDDKAAAVEDGLAFMDPGEHRVWARVSGATSMKRTVSGQAGEKVQVTLDLRPSGGTVLPGASPSNTPPGAPSRPHWPLVVAGVALGVTAVATAVSFGLGITSAGNADELEAKIRADSGQTPHLACAVSDKPLYDTCEEWRSERRTATDLQAVGIASTAALGTVLVFGLVYKLYPPAIKLGGDDAATAAMVAPVITTNGGALTIGGRF